MADGHGAMPAAHADFPPTSLLRSSLPPIPAAGAAPPPRIRGLVPAYDEGRSTGRILAEIPAGRVQESEALEKHYGCGVCVPEAVASCTARDLALVTTP